jgi:hypothetical protein
MFTASSRPDARSPELLVLQIRGADAVVSICTELLGEGVISQQLVLLPCLKRLLLLDCLKLRALPEDLHRAVNSKRIHIEGAHKLQEVVWLKVKNNKSLRRISNLHKLQDLRSMKRLYMVDCLNRKQFRNCLLKEEQDILVHVATVGVDGRDIFPDESLYH